MSHSQEKTTAHSCPACSYGPFTRNNYFTGKLLVERDFTDETRFHMEKLRHHEQALHGWGVVCGLKVKPHPNAACRDRFICIEPGSAVDCCGHDIIVLEEECIDITRLPSLAELIKNKDSEPHKLQVCIRFRECPNEEIPVLYDDCGCDDTKCAPNRILESFEIDVIIDPPAEPPPLHTPKFEWNNSVGIAHASGATLHDASHRLYVATADSPGSVYQVSTDNHSTVTSRTLPAAVLAMAVSNDGKHLYVVTSPTGGATAQQLHVLDTTQAGMPDFNASPIDIPNSGGSEVRLAVAPDGRLLALVLSTGDLFRWDADLDTNANPAAPVVVKNLGANVSGLALSSDGKTAFSLGPNDEIQALDIAAAAVTVIKVLPTGAKPSSLAVVASTGPDLLAVCDQANSNFYLVALTPSASLVGTVKLDHPPIALVVSPGGHWGYVLESDGSGSTLQPIDIDRVHLGLPASPGAAFKVGTDSRQLAISASGARLYIPYVDSLASPAVGGVAIIEVSEQACEEILWRHLEGCPHCDLPNCVVLATIENYQVGDRIEAQTDPLTDPADDLKNKIARINNRLGRRLLPSTEVLLELIECLSEHGGGGAGQQGPPGPPGKDGKDGKDGTNGKDGKDGTNGKDGTDGKDGQDGAPGPGMELGLTRIEALSWTHNHIHTAGEPPDANSFFVDVDMGGPGGQNFAPGLVIGFTDRVRFEDTAEDLARFLHIFEVLAEDGVPSDPDHARGFVCRCPIRGLVIPVDLPLDANGRIVTNASGRIEKAKRTSVGKVRGAAFIFDRTIPIERGILSGAVPELWVTLRGDFVIDTKERAIDAEFVRAELPTGDRPRPPAGQPLKDQSGIQGGTFESWFMIRPKG